MAKSKTSKSTQTLMEKPVWLKYTEEEIKAIILKLANKGMTSEKIGLVLRDQYGIPKVKLYNLKISKILKEKDIFQEPTDKNLRIKLERIINHHKKNKHDRTTERALVITNAKLKKSEEYLSRNQKNL